MGVGVAGFLVKGFVGRMMYVLRGGVDVFVFWGGRRMIRFGWVGAMLKDDEYRHGLLSTLPSSPLTVKSFFGGAISMLCLYLPTYLPVEYRP